ncbi:MAG: nucleoside-diphosphate sugar epimerase/dehydratase [Syntrophomonas sp.]
MLNALRYIILMLIDAALVNLAVYLTLLFRFDARIPAEYIQNFSQLIPVITIITLLFLAGLKIYSRIWQYASIGEMLAILRAISYSMAVIVFLIYLVPLPHLPRSVYIGSWIMINAFIGASRIGWRIWRDLNMRADLENFRRIIIAGAGDAGALLAREIHSNPRLKLKAVGFVDDDSTKQHMILSGIPVLGRCADISGLVEGMDIDEIIIAMPSVSGEIVREIFNLGKNTRARVRILPGVYESTSSSIMANIRDVQMEDLLRREPVQIDLRQVAGYVSEKTVLVTGAGGSIGSELCRQLLKFSPEKLVMAECGENELFEIDMELNSTDRISRICPELVDVRNHDRLEDIFKKYRPNVIFHAAAFKHVPMMERHPEEAIRNNVFGTQNAAELAHTYGAESFIFISTDKAVNPTSIMGSSKRIAELIIKDINSRSKTSFAAVRFGNVLGSRGSVIPTFIKQIEKGGPVTVTDPEMTRFFMTIPEAVQLVIQAGAIAQGGEIFVLNMGRPVKIDDLARDLISLSGLQPEIDIDIVYTGIRPGEKLYEELFTGREEMAATRHQRIFISRKELDQGYKDINEYIRSIKDKNDVDRNQVYTLIHQLVPEFQGEALAEEKNTSRVIYLQGK